MATPVYSTNLTDFKDFEAVTTISTELTGYTDTSKGDDNDGDYPIQGTQHASAEQRTAATGSLAADYGSNVSWTSGHNFFMWGIFLAPAAVNTDANAGIEMAVCSAITTFYTWTVGGSDFGRYPYGGWQNFVVNPEISTGRTSHGGGAGTSYRWVGMCCDVVSAITKGSPYGIDVIRYGRGDIVATNGDATDGYCTFGEMANANDANDISFTTSTTNTDATLTSISPSTDLLYPGAPIAGTNIPATTYIKSITDSTTAEMTNNATGTGTSIAVTSQPYNVWGLFSYQGGSYLYKGLMSIGTAGTSVDFRDSNRNIVIDNSRNILSTFNAIEVNHSSSNVEWENINISSLSTVSPGTFEMVDNATVDMTTCVFSDMSTFIFDSNATVLNSTFQRCALVTAGGGDFFGSKVLESTVAADTGAILCSGTYTDTYFDNMTFSKGTNAHHAIAFSTSVTSNLTLRNCAFTGFGSTDDSNDSTVQFLATSGSLTLSLVGCTVDGVAATAGNFSIDDAVGTLTVTLSIDPVTLSIHVDDNDGNNLDGARVYVAAADGTGDLPYNDSVTGITRSGTVATVDMTAHGLNVGEYVNLDGITGDKTADNWGAQEVLTAADADTFTYATADEGDTNYTGTITATGVLIDDVTVGGGDISASRTLAASQPITGVVRKSSSGATRFKSFTLGGTVDNSNGLTINVRMIKDE